MRLWALRFLCVVVLRGSLPCLAQQPGPATPESLLDSDPAQEPAEAEPKRPAGTVSRPTTSVQHPDLDRAWADYDAAVAKASESIKAAIAKQFDAATAKGDLDAAEKWQVISEKFEKAGELPAETEKKAAVVAAVSECKKAREELTKTYEAVIKSLTIDKKIDEAKAARTEKEAIADAPWQIALDPIGRGKQPAAPNAINVALGRPCKQSSVYRATGSDHGPDLGVDGESELLAQPSGLVITGPDDPPWWEVDLEQIRTLKELKFYNRKDCCQERAKTLKVLILANGRWEEVYRHNGDLFNELTVDLKGRKARFVRLELAEPVQLNFRECEIFGH